MPLNLRIALIPFYLMLLACVLAITVPPVRAEVAITFPQAVQQSAMVIGRVPPGSRVEYAGRELRVTGYGTVVLGVPRDAQAQVTVKVTPPNAAPQEVAIRVEPRAWDVERISGVPPRTVSPPPGIAERIRREQAEVSASRGRDDPRTDFAEPFVWPVKGRISGRFGNMRVYDGTPGAPHSGMDIAAANGTPVVAPASGVVTFANPDLYLTGGTLLLDHGYGISSNFLHLSRIDVEVGQRVEQGEVIGAVGATGRATGPHLHWGMNWFDVRLDPLLVLERSADR
ncbi:M23 family metallopeptidase [Halotalea alkalilenta]|uniref:M23 family metallopeptidase n=1 Tax=Halotalea alkalilenta TaxID=376489 RepID=UPI000AA8AFB7|nr:M23 family metallopeptidase [Halotalea alkalilenta]